MLREYSGNAKATTLVGALSASGTSILVADGTGYPTGATGPFVVTLAAGTSAEEKVLIDTRSGNTLTVETGGRGWDGTSASDHDNGVSVQHTFSATDAREANTHVNDTTGDPHPQYIGATEQAYDSARLGGVAAPNYYTISQANAAYVAKAGVTAATVLTSESTTSGPGLGVDLTTVGPVVTVTTGTRALLHLSAQVSNSTAGAGCRMAVAVSGATTRAASTDEEIYYVSATSGAADQHGITVLVDGLTAGSNTFTLKYAANGGTATFAQRHLVVVPL